MRSARFCTAIGVAAIVAGSLWFASAQTRRGEKYAFLVVCSKYNSTQLRDLPYTIEEMQDFRKALIKTGFDADHIILLHDQADRERMPEKQKIEKQFRLLLNGLQADDSVVVAINGHGVHYQGDRVGYYCPLGADLKDKKTLVSMEFFYDLLKKSKARQKLMIVQACQNDPFVSNDLAAERLEFGAKNDEVPEGIAAIFSCMEGQKSYYDPDRKRGLFFDHVIRSWNGEYLPAGEKKLDIEEFFRQVRVKTKADALRFRGGVEQVPEVRREYKGEWLIAAAAPVRPAPPKEKLEEKKIAGKGDLKAPKLGDIITNSIGMKLTYIAPGTFMMGSHKTELERREDEFQHEVEITKGFYIGVYAVTQEEYEKVMHENPSYFNSMGLGKDEVAGIDTRRFPVETVSWTDAKEFCRKLSLSEGKTYWLPTEAQWEYACRAGTKSPFHFGETISADQANYNANSTYGDGKKGLYRKRSIPVGSFPPNAWGLHDMHGNVWQWCEDWYDEEYYEHSPRIDPEKTKGPETFGRRVLRGGSWKEGPNRCRSAARHSALSSPLQDVWTFGPGFRVVLSRW